MSLPHLEDVNVSNIVYTHTTNTTSGQSKSVCKMNASSDDNVVFLSQEIDPRLCDVNFPKEDRIELLKTYAKLKSSYHLKADAKYGFKPNGFNSTYSTVPSKLWKQHQEFEKVDRKYLGSGKVSKIKATSIKDGEYIGENYCSSASKWPCGDKIKEEDKIDCALTKFNPSFCTFYIQDENDLQFVETDYTDFKPGCHYAYKGKKIGLMWSGDKSYDTISMDEIYIFAGRTDLENAEVKGVVIKPGKKRKVEETEPATETDTPFAWEKTSEPPTQQPKLETPEEIDYNPDLV